jgi:GPH family glycoside/pentoside/hexuronide:cation symporter/probable glucitol transport protein GutA
MVSFGTKLGNAIGGSIGILGLAAVGFVANTEMSSSVLSNMDKVINFGPAIIYILAGIFYAQIHMTNAKGKENEPKIQALQAQMAAAHGESAEA